MIKEKTTYISTITGKEYSSFTEAVKEEKAAHNKNVNALINKFRETKQEAKNAFSKLHEKYDPVLNELLEELNNCGIDVSALETDDESGRNAKVVNVRVSSAERDDISEILEILGLGGVCL